MLAVCHLLPLLEGKLHKDRICNFRSLMLLSAVCRTCHTVDAHYLLMLRECSPRCPAYGKCSESVALSWDGQGRGHFLGMYCIGSGPALGAGDGDNPVLKDFPF